MFGEGPLGFAPTTGDEPHWSEPAWVRRREWLSSDHPESNSLGAGQKLASVLGFHPQATYHGREWDEQGRFTYAVIDLGDTDQNGDPVKGGRILLADKHMLEGARDWSTVRARGSVDRLDALIGQIDADAQDFTAGNAVKVYPHGMMQQVVLDRAAAPDPLEANRPGQRPSSLLKM
ncbi:MAG: hypothetical protein KI792_13645 [Alphaproteobacteria bacterium]|nr:hypothetical protein [Alphaproteobacteria bacterium SS10]